MSQRIRNRIGRWLIFVMGCVLFTAPWLLPLKGFVTGEEQSISSFGWITEAVGFFLIVGASYHSATAKKIIDTILNIRPSNKK